MWNIEGNKNIFKSILLVLIIILVVIAQLWGQRVHIWLWKGFKPLIYAFLMAYLLDSAVKAFVKYFKIRRSQGILLSCIILFCFLIFTAYKILPQTVESINNIINFITDDGNVDEFISHITDKIDNSYMKHIEVYILQLSIIIKGFLNAFLVNLSEKLVILLKNIGSGAITAATSFIINIYMLVEKDDLINRLKRFIRAYFNENRAKEIIEIFKKANEIFKSFLNGKLLDSSIVGVVCIILFHMFNVPYAAFMGAVIGFFNIIPFFGPIIGSVPVIVVSFFIEPSKALAAFIIILIVQQLDANILEPKIVGRNVGVSPFWIIISVTLGGNLFGIPGMIFGVPFVVLIKTLMEESINLRLIKKGED